MNTTEDLRKAMRGEPLPADRVDPVALLRLGRRRRRLRRLGVAAASSLTAAGVALAAQLGLPPGVGPAGPAGEPTATDAPVNQAPALEPDGPVPQHVLECGEPVVRGMHASQRTRSLHRLPWRVC